MTKKVMLIGGIFICFISFIILWRYLKEKEITENNKIVNVEVIEAPSPSECGYLPSRGGYCTLKYNGEEFVKKAGNKYCSEVAGKKYINMLSNEKETIFIFMNEYNKSELYQSLILLALGLYFIFYYKIHKKKLISQ